MNFKSERGYSVIDIAVSTIVLFIFVSIIAVLSYNFNSTSKELELESTATYIAINEIEEMKNKDFSEIAELGKTDPNAGVYLNLQEDEEQKGFFKKVVIEDYADLAPNKTFGLVKKVTVEVSYNFKANEKKVALSTILTKEI